MVTNRNDCKARALEAVAGVLKKGRPPGKGKHTCTSAPERLEKQAPYSVLGWGKHVLTRLARDDLGRTVVVVRGNKKQPPLPTAHGKALFTFFPFLTIQRGASYMLPPPCWSPTLPEVILESRSPVLVSKQPPESLEPGKLEVEAGAEVLATPALPVSSPQPRLWENAATFQIL